MGIKYLDEYRDPVLAKRLLERIHRISTRPASLMEFCGGHTVAILKFGLRQLLPPTITMLSGPGCPVCVTAQEDIDRAIALSKVPGLIITTFGDMMRVPGSEGSLQEAKAEGADVRVVYSTMDALQIARNNPKRRVVFLGIGFETTAPTVALSVKEALADDIDNYCVLSLLKLTPLVMRALLRSGEVALDGIIGPGHVATVIGSGAWEFLPREYSIPCVVSGFEPLDILRAILMLIEEIETGVAEVRNAYPRSVRPEGNRVAKALMEEVFEVKEAQWRGVGTVAESGLGLKTNYRAFDAEGIIERHGVVPQTKPEPRGCLCGEVLRGVRRPTDCQLFRKVCTPLRPVGPCMVSSEGVCAAYYQYGAENG